MKLVFKPSGDLRGLNLFALHTGTGELLPQQVKTTLISECDRVARIIVEFNVDGEEIVVEGTE